MRSRGACLSALAIAGALFAGPARAEPTWIELPPMHLPRGGCTATLLQDGRVLVAGASFYSSGVDSAEIFDPATRTWSDPIPMSTGHGNHASALLADGRVLILGGFVDQFTSKSRVAEVFSPATGSFTPVKQMLRSHTYAPATVLADGRVVIAGGYNAFGTAEVYDPVADTWAQGMGKLQQTNFYHPAARLPDGRVMIPGGGFENNGAYPTLKYVDIFDPVKFALEPGPALIHGRRSHTATELADGRVMVTGGIVGGSYEALGAALDSTEVYDPAKNQWTLSGALHVARHHHAAVRLPSGAVLVTGGLDHSASSIESAEVWDGAEWHVTTPMLHARESHTATLLPDGTVLVIGGAYQSSVELFVPDDLGAACESGVTCKSGFCASGVCCESACGEGCRACDMAGFEGKCRAPCADAGHVLACGDGALTCGAGASCVLASCGAYRCDQEAGSCRETCHSVADCAAGFACDLEGACVPPPAVVSGAPGACGVATPMDREGESPWLLVLLGSMTLVRRRVRRAR